MKIFFYLLLLSNIVFAVVQWLMPYDQFFSESRPIAAAEQLRLLNETTSQSVSQIENQAQAAPTLVESIPKEQLCYTLGPFKQREQAQEIIQRFEQNQLPVTSRPSVEKEYLGLMVYIDGHTTRQQARKTAKSLAEKGVRDYMIVNEDDKPFALSLGVFGLKKNADRRIQRIERLGYDVKSEARYRNRTIYWLDYDQPENDNLQRVIDRLKIEQGVSRISRVCG
ncbi:MAG: hypothetical protein QNJ56_03830 [Gammaproteobacteria bacterium]|nr:hypothetical protein [Gammaproteobacteria bacterium]